MIQYKTLKNSFFEKRRVVKITISNDRDFKFSEEAIDRIFSVLCNGTFSYIIDTKHLKTRNAKKSLEYFLKKCKNRNIMCGLIWDNNDKSLIKKYKEYFEYFVYDDVSLSQTKDETIFYENDIIVNLSELQISNTVVLLSISLGQNIYEIRQQLKNDIFCESFEKDVNLL